MYILRHSIGVALLSVGCLAVGQAAQLGDRHAMGIWGIAAVVGFFMVQPKSELPSEAVAAPFVLVGGVVRRPKRSFGLLIILAIAAFVIYAAVKGG